MNEMERLEQILNRLCQGNKTKLGDRLGISQQAASAWFTNHTFNVGKLQKAFPEVSTQWLMFGTGPMLECDITMSEDEALATLGITRDQLEAIRTGHVSCDQSHDNHPSTVSCDQSHENTEGTPTRPYDSDEPRESIYVAEGAPVDRAMLNLLMRDNDRLQAERLSKEKELEIARQRILELEKENSTLTERLRGAAGWFYDAVQKHPDLKP